MNANSQAIAEATRRPAAPVKKPTSISFKETDEAAHARILVVDDQPANIQHVSRILGGLGHEIIPALEGAAGRADHGGGPTAGPVGREEHPVMKLPNPAVVIGEPAARNLRSSSSPHNMTVSLDCA